MCVKSFIKTKRVHTPIRLNLSGFRLDRVQPSDSAAAARDWLSATNWLSAFLCNCCYGPEVTNCLCCAVGQTPGVILHPWQGGVKEGYVSLWRMIPERDHFHPKPPVWSSVSCQWSPNCKHNASWCSFTQPWALTSKLFQCKTIYSLDEILLHPELTGRVLCR